MKKLISFLLAVFLFVSSLLFVVPSASAVTWQDYLVEILKTGNISQAAIISKDGTSVLAHSEGFEPSASERKVLVDAYKNRGISSKLFTLNGTEYNLLAVLVTLGDGLLYGVKPDGGAVIAKSEEVILIGTYGNNIVFSNAYDTLKKAARKLDFQYLDDIDNYPIIEKASSR